MVYRLYLVNRETGKSTGKKRDYPSHEHLIKYAQETFERYNREFYYTDTPTELKAKLCFLNNENKWEELAQKDLEKVKKEWYENKR